MRTAFFLASTLTAFSVSLFAEPMYVSICNQVGISEKTLSRAQEEIEQAYRAAGVAVHWVECDGMESAVMEYGGRFFVIRLGNRTIPHSARSVSLDAMGRAYTERRGSGYLADVYLASIVEFGNDYGIDLEILLGLVISHELGHLLLGPGHSVDGIMVAKWTRRETEAGRKRWLRFNAAQAAMIIEQLQSLADR